MGCGNILLGDDGLGPEAVEYLTQNYSLPDNMEAVDAATGVRDILFDIALSEQKPRRIILIDAVDFGKTPGEIIEIPLEGPSTLKKDQFSRHQLPTSQLLKELRDLCAVEVIIIAVQVENIPELVSTGLSEAVRRAIPLVCEKILALSK